MDDETKARIEAAGFVETTVQEFLGLTDAENELVETRIRLSRLVKQLRADAHVNQTVVAKRIGSDQSRIARAEKNDPSVSIDLLFRAAYALGASREQVAHALMG